MSLIQSCQKEAPFYILLFFLSSTNLHQTKRLLTAARVRPTDPKLPKACKMKFNTHRLGQASQDRPGLNGIKQSHQGKKKKREADTCSSMWAV